MLSNIDAPEPPRPPVAIPPPAAAQILLIEDDLTAHTVATRLLRSQGYGVHAAYSGVAALRLAAATPLDLILLDLQLPDIAGRELCLALPALTDAPIIVLSGRSDEATKAALLDAGAADYVTKPFGERELAARIRVALRHAAQLRAAAGARGERRRVGDLLVDMGQRTAWLGDARVELTRTEWALLAALLRHRGQLLSYDQLTHELWPDRVVEGNGEVHRYVRQLRQKLGPSGTLIANVRGVGYMLVREE